jgi:hypothetical protein
MKIEFGTTSFDDAAMKSSLSLDKKVRELTDKGLSDDDIIERMVGELTGPGGPLAEFGKYLGEITAETGATSLAERLAIEQAGGDRKALGVWVATGMSNMCPGCAKLHGKKMTLEEFLTTHGTNECGSNCYCVWGEGEGEVPAENLVVDQFEKEEAET